MFDSRRRNAFLEALADTGSASCAAAMVGIDRTTAYVWRRRHPGFAARWQKALARFRVFGPVAGIPRNANLGFVLRKLHRMARVGSAFFDNELPVETPQSLEDQGLGDFR
jgi:hypothetical protein